MSAFKDQVLALTALIQAATLASELALTGVCDHVAAQMLIDAVYVVNTPSTEQLYPASQLTGGLKTFITLFDTRHTLKPAHQSLARYIVKLNALAKKLTRNPTLLAALSVRLKQAGMQHDFFVGDVDRHALALSELYLWLAAELKIDFKLMGQAQYLQDSERVNRIRALLLAGVRAAVLWQQLGGNAWRLWWRRKTYLSTSKQLLSGT